jgi:hypothetical protein
MDVGVASDRFVRGRQQIVQILGDPLRLGVGERLQVVLGAEDGDGRKVAILVFDREVGDEALGLAGVVDVPLLQGAAHTARRASERIAANDRVKGLVVVALGAQQRCGLIRPEASRR